MSSSKETYRSELRAAIRQLGDLCLYSAAKWAAELLVGIEPDTPPFSSSFAASGFASSRATPSTSSASRFLPHHRDGSSFRRRLRSGGAPDVTAAPVAGVSYVSTPSSEDDGIDGGGGGAGDCYLVAKSYFDRREYRRAAHALRGQTGRKHVFLRCYALYMQRFGENVGQLLDPSHASLLKSAATSG